MRKQHIILRDEGTRRQLIQMISVLNLEKPWEITVGKFRKKRTNPQNNLRWMWVEDVVAHVREHTGMDKYDIDDFFKGKFLSPTRFEIGGETYEKHTTSGLSTEEMAAYMDDIYRWVTSELGILLPLPEDRREP